MILTFFLVGPVLAFVGLLSMRALLSRPLPEGAFPLSHKVSVIAATGGIFFGCALFISAIDLSIASLHR